MEQAWLDSLSEDWVSQPRSSASPAPSLPSFSNSISNSSASCLPSSRIPKFNSQKQAWTSPHDSSNNPLAERSPSVNNIPPSQRGVPKLSKLREEISHNAPGRGLSRTQSTSNTHSAKYNTIQHNQSVSHSPKKGPKETPEWKKRLLHGEVPYGEQRDLFSAAGLESIFRPPPPQAMSPPKFSSDQNAEGSVMMPSSPPPYDTGHVPQEGAEDRNFSEEQLPEQFQPRQQPRVMKYRMADEDVSDFSKDDLSRSSSFRPQSGEAKNRDEGEDVFSDPSSSLDHSLPQRIGLMDGVIRMVSGQSDIRNEELSPIYISKQNTIDGKIDYAALDLSATELQARLESLQIGSQQSQVENDPNDSSKVHPGDITVGTDDYAHNGRFINLRRGGHSEEGSFQKRMLSSSSFPAADESAMLPEESMQASTPKQLPTIRKTRTSNEFGDTQITSVLPPMLRAPPPSPSKPNENDTKSNPGSPLKLFGTYDTFTNQKLLRRLSQFEENFENTEEGLSLKTVQESTHPELNEGFVAASSPVKVSQQINVNKHASRKVNSFGEGDLNDFQFSEEISYDSSRGNSHEDDQENTSLPILDPTTQTSFKFHLGPSPALEEGTLSRRTTRYTTTTTTKKQTSVRKIIRPETASSQASTDLLSAQRQEELATPRKRNVNSGGKRLPKSPLKDPTPKRRRTLNKAENIDAPVIDNEHEIDSLRETHQQMQSAIGSRKRKDARYDDDQHAANPKVLAMRQILRPRTPTPSQRSSQQRENAPFQEENVTSPKLATLLQQQKIAKIQAELDSTEARKGPSALGMSLQMQDDSRKGSVTTQDFLDEAKKIMAGIRGKVRPRSGLTSLEESEAENDRNACTGTTTEDEVLEDSYEESTKEPFSRPPSRDGPPIPRQALKQQDPELLDHLRKYEERSDIEGIIASSMKSIAMAKDTANSVRKIERVADETVSRSSGKLLQQDNTLESNPPNIRITESPELQRKRKHSTSSAPTVDQNYDGAEYPSQGSNGSSNQSTSRSIPTGSSRGSGSRHVIAPHTVSHLIGEQVAGMVFDRARNIWVKRKSVTGEVGEQNFLPSDETEDDPFGDIPDLSVDETQELQRIKAVAARRREEERVAQVDQNGDDGSRIPNLQNSLSGKLHSGDQLSSEHSKLSPLASRDTAAENNASLTSWGDENGPALISKAQGQQIRNSTKTEIREEVVEEVEREISIHEDRVNPSSPRRRRNVTISFSSPLASIIEPQDDEQGFEREQDEASQSGSDHDNDFSDGSVIISKRSQTRKVSSMKTGTALRNGSRRLSLGGHKFSARPVSRIDEQDEESLRDIDERNRRSVSIIVSTPAHQRRFSAVALATPRPSHEIGTLELTPLSDFTMHQEDESLGLEVSYIEKRHHYVLGSGSKRAFSLSIKDLVSRITEVEPYEPFWEHMKQMDLKNKRLSNLHKLDEFCEQLEELDVSDNQISQLDGAPRSLRNLRISCNYLSDLSAWGHLNNLQYLDVSNNEIESLSAFKSLIHLRDLRADNNKIKSLDGIGHLDGLLTLRLRGNLIESIDFKGTDLQRLTDLDLNENRIRKVQNLHELHSLSSLCLEGNNIDAFEVDSSQQLWAMKYLKLSRNNLESIDVNQCPNLRLLYLDCNRLGAVTGLLRTKHLDSLSLREQQKGAVIDSSFLSEAFEVRKLFLSGNLLNEFRPRCDFLNLQYLELANCGLETLPLEFGQMLSNTRVLNLNFNALRDIRPLLGIVRLKKLHLAGNRLARLRKTTNVLAHFSTLTVIDLRSNPLTQGFYPPIIETRIVIREMAESGDPVPEPFTLGKSDRDKDERYASRLDMGTRMLRRVYEMLVLSGCGRLKILDGLDVDRCVFEVKDKVWASLIRADIVKGELLDDAIVEQLLDEEEKPIERPPPGKEGTTEESNSKKEKAIMEEIWPAEDSFG
jgi:Leucine-rich repeat (LRR) protein